MSEHTEGPTNEPITEELINIEEARTLFDAPSEYECQRRADKLIKDRLQALTQENKELSARLSALCLKCGQLDTENQALLAALETVKKTLEDQRYTSHVEGGEGCEDDSYMGFGCSYCNTNKAMSEALDVLAAIDKAKGSK